MTDDYDIDVRPVSVDRLITFADTELVVRQNRVAELRNKFAGDIETLEAQLEKAQSLHQFLEKELANVILAQKLKAGDIVRVICPECSGTGMKAVDVLSGRVKNTGSAFESIQGKKKQAPELDPALQCKHCKGQRWVLMERFKG